MRHALLGLVFVGCSAAPVVPSARAPAGGLEVEPTSGLGLFADERAQSQALVAAALVARDAGIAPVEVTQRAWALAAGGKNPLTGAACGMPLGSYQARKRWGAALGITGSVNSDVWCDADGGCELNVYGRTLGESAARFKLVAPVPAGGAPLEALSFALARLTPPPPDEGALGDLLGGMGTGDSAPIKEEDRLDVRVWHSDRARAQLDETQRRQSFAALTVGQVQTCLSGGGERIELLIEVSTGGTIARCEAAWAEQSSPSSCGCGQLQKVAAAPWLAGKRWSVRLSIVRKDQMTSDRRFVLNGSWNTYFQVPGDGFPLVKPKVEDPSIEAWSPGSSRLATGCFTNAFSAAGHLTSRWAVWFDGAGRATKVVEQKAFAPLPKDLAACVARALRTAQSACPARAGLWAMADLRVSARDPNAPPATLKDLLK